MKTVVAISSIVFLAEAAAVVQGSMTSCTDTNHGGEAKNGYGCPDFEAHVDACTSAVWDDADFTSADMCCACGGGSLTPTPPPALGGETCASAPKPKKTFPAVGGVMEALAGDFYVGWSLVFGQGSALVTLVLVHLYCRHAGPCRKGRGRKNDPSGADAETGQVGAGAAKPSDLKEGRWVPVLTSCFGFIYLAYILTVPFGGLPVATSRSGVNQESASAWDKYLYPNPPHFGPASPRAGWTEIIIRQVVNGFIVAMLPLFVIVIILLVGIIIVITPLTMCVLGFLFWIAEKADDIYRSLANNAYSELGDTAEDRDDEDHNGVVTWIEMRNFLLMPTTFVQALALSAKLVADTALVTGTYGMFDVNLEMPDWGIFKFPTFPCTRVRVLWLSCRSYAILNSALYLFACVFSVCAIVLSDVLTVITDRTDRIKILQQGQRRKITWSMGGFCDGIRKVAIDFGAATAMYIMQLLAAQGAASCHILTSLVVAPWLHSEDWHTENIHLESFAPQVEIFRNEIGVQCYNPIYFVGSSLGEALLFFSFIAVLRVASGHAYVERIHITSAEYFAVKQANCLERMVKLWVIMKTALIFYLVPFVRVGLDGAKLEEFSKIMEATSGTYTKDNEHETKHNFRRMLNDEKQSKLRTAQSSLAGTGGGSEAVPNACCQWFKKAKMVFKFVQARVHSNVDMAPRQIESLLKLHREERKESGSSVRESNLGQLEVGGSRMADFYKSCSLSHSASVSVENPWYKYHPLTAAKMVIGFYSSAQLHAIDSGSRSRLWQTQIEKVQSQTAVSAGLSWQLLPYVGLPLGKLVEYSNRYPAFVYSNEEDHYSRSLRVLPNATELKGATKQRQLQVCVLLRLALVAVAFMTQFVFTCAMVTFVIGYVELALDFAAGFALPKVPFGGKKTAVVDPEINLVMDMDQPPDQSQEQTEDALEQAQEIVLEQVQENIAETVQEKIEEKLATAKTSDGPESEAPKASEKAAATDDTVDAGAKEAEVKAKKEAEKAAATDDTVHADAKKAEVKAKKEPEKAAATADTVDAGAKEAEVQAKKEPEKAAATYDTADADAKEAEVKAKKEPEKAAATDDTADADAKEAEVKGQKEPEKAAATDDTVDADAKEDEVKAKKEPEKAAATDDTVDADVKGGAVKVQKEPEKAAATDDIADARVEVSAREDYVVDGADEDGESSDGSVISI